MDNPLLNDTYCEDRRQATSIKEKIRIGRLFMFTQGYNNKARKFSQKHIKHTF